MKRRIVSLPFPTDQTWVMELPDKLKVAIADAIVVFGRLETIALETVWVLEDATLAAKKALARDWVTTNFRKMKRVVKKIPGATTDKIWPTLEDVANERNLIAHGYWMVTSEGRPLVLSHKFLESDDHVTAEFFDYSRFDYFIARASRLLTTFQQFKAMLEEIPRDQRIAAGLTIERTKRSFWQRINRRLRQYARRLRNND